MKLLKSLVIISIVAVASCSQPKGEQKDVIEVNIEGTEITYAADTVNMKGYIVRDVNTEGKKPGILVIHEWWGHNEYSRKRADMLAELGYVALAVDMYGDGKNTEHAADANQFMRMTMSNLDGATARFEAALELLKSQEDVDPESIGAIGYCFGGAVALSMANAGYDLDAVAAFHASLGLPVPPSKDIQGKIMVFNGAADPFVPADVVAGFRAAMDSVGADYEFINYEGAKHAFTSKGADALAEKNAEMVGNALAYDAAADSASWARATQFLASTLKK